MKITDVQSCHTQRILELNAGEVQYTSAMDMAGFVRLEKLAAYCKVALAHGEVAAFIIAMPSTTNYVNDNFSWFAARYDNFLYIDRIVVDKKFFSQGIGSKLYTDLLDFAAKNGFFRIVCEYNIKPLNAASQKFHAKFGFKEVGTQWLGEKKVSMQAVCV